jgi:hypothetical protein
LYSATLIAPHSCCKGFFLVRPYFFHGLRVFPFLSFFISSLFLYFVQFLEKCTEIWFVLFPFATSQCALPHISCFKETAGRLSEESYRITETRWK